MASNWREVRARAVAKGMDEKRVAAHKADLVSKMRAHRLSEVRSLAGLNQTELAERMGVSQSRVSKIENGDLEHTELATLRALAHALGGELEVMVKLGDERLTLA